MLLAEGTVGLEVSLPGPSVYCRGGLKKERQKEVQGLGEPWWLG